MKYTLIFLILLIAASATFVSAQTPERDAAIKHYIDGNDIEAIIALEALLKKKEYAADAEAINFLGLAYQNAQDAKGAKKMFEKAVKLQPETAAYRANLAYSYLLGRQLNKSQDQAKKALELDPANMSAYFVLGTADRWEGKPERAMETADKMIAAKPEFTPGYILKSDVLVDMLGQKVSRGSAVRDEVEFLRQAVEVLEEGIRKNTSPRSRKGIEEKLETIRTFYEHYSKDRPGATAGPTPPEPGVTPVKILYKPQARYTDAARGAGVQGTIRVAVLLGADGRIAHILKLKGLGYGLDEQVYQAARQIRFQPKMKDGKPVSTVVTIEYSFSIF